MARLTARIRLSSRFEEGQSATNPEELIGAAQRGVLHLALTAQLSRGRITPTRIHTAARVKTGKDRRRIFHHIDRVGDRADIPGMDDATFQKYALDAKLNCPVSKALAGTNIRLTAKLL